MVRKSLAESLTEEAMQFLEDGRPRRAEPEQIQHLLDLRSKIDPLSCLERALDVDFWTQSEREAIQARLLESYRRRAEQAGHRVTSSGLIDAAGKSAPTTRGLDKEMRSLKREIAILSEMTRQLLRVIVHLGGRSPKQLSELLSGNDRSLPALPEREMVTGAAVSEPASPRETEPADSRPAKAVETKTAEAKATGERPPETRTRESEPSAAPEKAHSETNGRTAEAGAAASKDKIPASKPEAAVKPPEPPEPPGRSPEESAARSAPTAPAEPEELPELVEELPELPEEASLVTPVVSRFRRTLAPPPGALPEGYSRFRRPMTTPAAAQPAPAPPPPAPDKLPHKRVIREYPHQVLRVKVCPRCRREVPLRAPRCLSCGKPF